MKSFPHEPEVDLSKGIGLGPVRSTRLYPSGPDGGNSSRSRGPHAPFEAGFSQFVQVSQETLVISVFLTHVLAYNMDISQIDRFEAESHRVAWSSVLDFAEVDADRPASGEGASVWASSWGQSRETDPMDCLAQGPDLLADWSDETDPQDELFVDLPLWGNTPVSPPAWEEPPQDSGPGPSPRLFWRATISRWTIQLRQDWGDRANQIQDAGLDWKQAERTAFEEVMARLRMVPAG